MGNRTIQKAAAKLKFAFFKQVRNLGNKKSTSPVTMFVGSHIVGGIMAGAIGGHSIYSNFTTQLRSANPQPTMINRAAWGPGYPTWFKTKGMPPDHLGASGDLTLALSKLKHQSII